MIDSFVDQLRTFLEPLGPAPYPLHEPTIHPEISQHVQACIDSGWISSVGEYVRRFESDLAAFSGAEYAVVTSTGTSALQVALRLSGVEAGDEVFVPSLSFVATATAVKYLGATPHFIDCDSKRLGLSPSALEEQLAAIGKQSSDGGWINRETGARIRAIVPMHAFGHAVDPAVFEVAKRHGISVVEDAAEALGSREGGVHLGTKGLLGILSFNGNKVITTGAGGAILTNDESLATQARHLVNTAKAAHRWNFYHDTLGYNFRMPALNASFGVGQMTRIHEILAAKRELANRYLVEFASCPLGQILREPEDCESNYWLNTLVLHEEHSGLQETLLATAHAHKLFLRPVWQPLHTLPAFCDSPTGPLPTTLSLAKRVINLPSSPTLLLPQWKA